MRRFKLKQVARQPVRDPEQNKTCLAASLLPVFPSALRPLLLTCCLYIHSHTAVSRFLKSCINNILFLVFIFFSGKVLAVQQCASASSHGPVPPVSSLTQDRLFPCDCRSVFCWSVMVLSAVSRWWDGAVLLAVPGSWERLVCFCFWKLLGLLTLTLTRTLSPELLVCVGAVLMFFCSRCSASCRVAHVQSVSTQSCSLGSAFLPDACGI